MRNDSGVANLVQKQFAEISDLNPTLRQQIEIDLKRYEANVERCKELLTLLEAHPETQRIMELLAQR